MTIRIGTKFICLTVLLLLSGAAIANPSRRTFNAPAEDVFRAAKKAAAGHRIVIPQDEGLKDLTDSGQEIQSFQFATAVPGVSFRVVEEINVEPQPDGSSIVEVFFRKDRGTIPYVPSSSYQAREQQLQNQLEYKLSALEELKYRYERQYKIIHNIDEETYVVKQKEILNQELAAKLEELGQERQAKIADLAGMPTSSFSTVDAQAEQFLNAIQQNLLGSKVKAAAGVHH